LGIGLGRSDLGVRVQHVVLARCCPICMKMGLGLGCRGLGLGVGLRCRGLGFRVQWVVLEYEVASSV